jgi:hypothetical protein
MTDMPAPAWDLFVSYAEADHAWVEGYLLDALRQSGVSCHTEATFRLGVPRLEEFDRAVKRSSRTLLVFSAASSADGFARFIDLLAQSHGAESATWPVIPLLRAPVELPGRLAMLTRLDACDPADWPDVVARLCAELRRPVPGPPPRPACPYPGMVAFGARDAHFFYGREAEIDQMLRHLRHQRWLFVIGPSGSGKSSLLHAGLLPGLARCSYFPEGFWRVRILRPGRTPVQALAEALGGDPSQPGPGLSGLLATHPPAGRLLLVVDPLEEMFTQSDPAERRRFIAALKGLGAQEGCALVISLRADFYQDLMNSDLWPVPPGQKLEVGPLRGEPCARPSAGRRRRWGCTWKRGCSNGCWRTRPTSPACCRWSRRRWPCFGSTWSAGCCPTGPTSNSAGEAAVVWRWRWPRRPTPRSPS